MFEDVKKAIRKKKPKRVLLQVPEGLKERALEIAEVLEKEGIETFISAEPCYGACDLRIHEAKTLGCDAILHLGHEKLIETEFNVIYVPLKFYAEIDAKKIAEYIKEKSIGLVTSIQYEHLLKNIAEELKKYGKDVEIGGSILGCNTRNAEKLKTECILFIGSGRFHALGLKDIRKKVYRYDVELQQIEEVDFYIEEKKRVARRAIFDDAKTIGIIISTKPGQLISTEELLRLKKKLMELGKKPYVIVMDEVKKEKLLKCDAYVNTACPRLVGEVPRCINMDELL